MKSVVHIKLQFSICFGIMPVNRLNGCEFSIKMFTLSLVRCYLVVCHVNRKVNESIKHRALKESMEAEVVCVCARVVCLGVHLHVCM